MNRDEAIKILEAWDFFDKHPSAVSWEGITRSEFYELMQVISGEEDLVAAREYLEKIRAGQISETVPAKLLAELKEGKVSQEKVGVTKRSIAVTRRWIASIKAVTPEEIAAKKAATTEAKAVLKEEPKEEIPPTPAAPETTFAAGETGGGAGTMAQAAGAAISQAATAPKILKVEMPVSVEKSIKSRIERTRDEVMFLPFRAVAAVAGPTLAKENPEAASAGNLVARGYATSMGAYAFEQQALASGASPKQIKELFNVMQNLPTPLVYRITTGHATWADLSYASFIDRRFSAAQVGAFIPSADNSTVVLSPQSFVGGIFQQIGSRIFGRAAAATLKGVLGGAGKAAATVGVEAAAGAATGTAAGAATGAAVGVVGGPTAIVTAAVGAIVGYLKSKIPDIVSWLKTHAKEFGAAALALFVGGVFLGNTVLIVSGGSLGALALAGGGTGAIAAGGRSMLQALFWGLTVLVLPSIAAPLIIAFVSLPIMLAIIFFIINSSAFLIPKQVNVAPPITLPFSLAGPLPAGVPTTWPVSGGYVVQGPNNSRYTHAGAQAIDIIENVGTPIKSTTDGVAKVSDFYPYGKHVEIQSQAGGVSFTVRYAHMSAISIADGQTVSAGQTIGFTGNTGLSSEPHLHYEFIGLPMAAPLIPKSITEGCWGSNECNFSLP